MAVDPDIVVLQESVTLPRSRRVLPNRLVKAAMYEALANFGGGPPNLRHFKLYKQWAQGQWGMVITGNIQVDPRHLTLGRDIVVPSVITPETVAPFVQLAQCFHDGTTTGPETLAIVQLSHAGRQSPRIIGGRGFFASPSAPSTVPLESRNEGDGTLSRLFHKFLFIPPHELNDDEIESVIQSFVRGAEVMRDAGFDGVQLHGSHGYLLAQFLSPKTNKRGPPFGHPNNLHIVREIATRIRAIVPDSFVLGIKLNAADCVEGGTTEEEALQQVREISEMGLFDFIEISGGDYERLDFMKDPTPREAFFASFSRLAMDALPKTPNAPLIMLTGSLRTPSVMAKTVHAQHAHLVGVGRASVICPSLPQRIFTGDSISDFPSPPAPSWLSKAKIRLLGSGSNTAWYCALMYRLGTDRWKGMVGDSEVPDLGAIRCIYEVFFK